MINKGDDIYFQSKQGPKSGCVRSVGKHGATVECDGEHHKVKHHHVLGVKQAMERKFKMIDKGGDGSLVEDEEGKRQYIAGNMPEAEGYLDKLTSLDSADDGDLVTRRIEREMHGTRCYQVLGDKLPEGSVYVGESSKRAVRLLGHLDTVGSAVPYDVVSRSIIEGQDEKHGVLFAFSPEEDQLQELVNAVARFQRKNSLDTEDIMVLDQQVSGMNESVLSRGMISGRQVLILGEREGFEGNPVYVSADLEHMMKARTLDNSTVLFMKAGAIKNRAGLSLQDVTDKLGHVEKRWKRTGQPVKKEREPGHKQDAGNHSGSKKLPDMEHGDSVGFQAGNASGAGEIVASGKDGAVVKDESGREHNVHWNEMTDHSSKNKKVDKTEKIDNPESKQAWDKEVLFSSEEMSISKTSIQKDVDSWEGLVKQAETGLGEYKKWLGGLSEKQGWQTFDDDFDAAIDSIKAGDSGIKVIIAGLKGEDRAAEKVETEPAGWAGLRDMVRGTVAVDSLHQLPEALNLLRESGMKISSKPKNRFADPTSEGYRDIMLNVELPGGQIAELQINTKNMILAKKEGHKPYERIRTLKEGAEKEGRSLTVDESSEVKDLTAESTRIYSKAWDVDTASQKVTKPLKKAILFNVRRVL